MRRRMKGGKDEKTMGPLFPRLQINDTERRGPKAPPRNRMALYELLSIPSQRCSSDQTSSLPLPPVNCSKLVRQASSSQGARHERNVIKKLHSGSSDAVNLNMTASDFELKFIKIAKFPSLNDSRHLSCTTGYGSLLPHDFSSSQKSCGPKIGYENDLMLPVFIHPKITQSSSKYPRIIDQERHTQSSPSKPDCSKVILGNSIPKVAANSISSSMQLRNSREKHLKRTNTTDLTSRQHGKNLGDKNLKESFSNKEMQNLASDSLTKENTSVPLKHRNVDLNQDPGSGPVEDIKGEDNNDALKNREYKAGFLLKNTAHSNVVLADSEMRNVSRGDTESSSRASLWDGHRSSNEPENGRNYTDEKVHCPLQIGIVDRKDESSEASMVDSVSHMEISPDDVLGAIGQKQFWNTRRAIVNQQRLFAAQVFELHRLIKVQRLIAGSPHLLLEDNPFLSKPCLEISSAKELPSEYVLKSPLKIEAEDESQRPSPDSTEVKPPDPSPPKVMANESQKQNQGPDPAVVKCPDPLPPKIMDKDESQKPNQGLDSAVKPSDSSPSDALNKRVVTQNSGYGPYSGKLPPPVAAENKAGLPWCFHPPLGSQWLLPIIPPSEGKTCSLGTGAFPQTAGFMTPIYGGGWGPVPVPSMAGGCLNPSFGFPGLGILSGVSPAAQAHSPVMTAVNSASPFGEGSSSVGFQPDRQAKQLLTGEANVSMKSGSLSNIFSQNDETISFLKTTQTPKDGESQKTTMIIFEREAQAVSAVPVSERKDELTLFPMTPSLVVSDRVPQTEKCKQQTPVIRVVPHNPRTAPESAARIFRFIQEERQQLYVPV